MYRSLLVGVCLILMLPAPRATAQANTPAPHPDPAPICLSQADLDGWSQTAAVRTETWPVQPGPPPPVGYGAAYGFESEFTETTPDGSQLSLRTDVGEGAQPDLDHDFADLQHGALDQQPIALPNSGVREVAWWETAGSTRQAHAAAVFDGVIVELELTGAPTAPDPSLDDRVVGWLDLMIGRVQAASDQPPFDWTRLAPSAPWTLVLDQGDVDGDWQPASGLELVSIELASSAPTVRADVSYDRTGGVYRRTLTSEVTVFGSVAAATTATAAGSGTAVLVPPLGDQTAAFRSVENDPTGTGDVQYTVNVRRGAIVSSVQDDGASTSLTSPDEAVSLARQADAKLSGSAAGVGD